MITLDTSGLFALVNRSDRDHARVMTALLEDPGPYVVPAGILAEVAYLIERALHPDVLDAFLADLQSGGYTLECGEADLTRIRELTRYYAELPLGFADAAVIACAERHGRRVLNPGPPPLWRRGTRDQAYTSSCPVLRLIRRGLALAAYTIRVISLSAN